MIYEGIDQGVNVSKTKSREWFFVTVDKKILPFDIINITILYHGADYWCIIFRISKN